MPLDYRRFNGPDDSVSYKCYTEQHNSKPFDVLYNELFNDKGQRKDGRALDEARTMCMFYARTDMVSQAKGSSYVELKKTKVVCSVFDPREIPRQSEFSKHGKIFCEVKFAPFSSPRKRLLFAPDAEEKALSVALRKALEPTVCRHLFPNYQVDVFIYILENDGACLAAAINAAGLALASAAVPMFGIITACSVAYINGQMFLDPTEAEEYLATTSIDTDTNHGIITMSMLWEIDQIPDFTLIGSMDVECVTKTIEILEVECERILPYIDKVVVTDVIERFEQREKQEEEAKQREEFLNKEIEEWKKILNAG